MDFLRSIGNAFSSLWSSISTGFSNMFGGFGGGSAGGTAGAIGAATLATGMAATPAPSMATPGYFPQPQPIAYPSPAANPYAVNNAGGQVLNAAATQVLSRMGGTAGAVASPIVDGVFRVADMQMRANQNGAISCAAPGQPMGPTPNLNGAFSASCGAYQARLEAANQAGAKAMMDRAMNQAQTNLWNRVIPSTGHPGGAFGKLLGKL